MATKAGGNIVEMTWDPVTRIVGSLGIYAKIDWSNKTVVECHSTSSVFRGYSIFMKGKDPRDAHFITSRICGICGDNHATCSVYAQNMAYGIAPPHLGEWIINCGEAAEYMFDHNIFQENLVGVDYCERMVRETNPGVLEKANNTEAPHAADHGYRTIGDIMRSLNPLEGDFYREALPGYEHVAERRILLGCWGSLNDPEHCDFKYEHMTDWGRRMCVTPGVIVDGNLVTNDLVDINLGIRILLGHSYYDDWEGSGNEKFVERDPLGNPVDIRHPGNQHTLP